MDIILEGLWWILIECLCCYPGALILKLVTRSKAPLQKIEEKKNAKSCLTGLAFWVLVIFVISRIAQRT